MKSHDPQLKAKALALSMKEGPKAAAEATGISSSTIRAWRAKAAAEARAAEKTLEMVIGEKISKLQAAPNPEELGRRSHALAALALDRIQDQLEQSEEERAKGADYWLRAVVGAYKVLAETGNLLLGGPTARAEELYTGTLEVKRQREVAEVLASYSEVVAEAEGILTESSGDNGHRK
ncbi:MAG: hypothetical protein WC116_09965 [Thermovirgaceae bacterium]|jgi:sugar phosphate isomerase/epimerase